MPGISDPEITPLPAGWWAGEMQDESLVREKQSRFFWHWLLLHFLIRFLGLVLQLHFYTSTDCKSFYSNWSFSSGVFGAQALSKIFILGPTATRLVCGDWCTQVWSRSRLKELLLPSRGTDKLWTKADWDLMHLPQTYTQEWDNIASRSQDDS